MSLNLAQRYLWTTSILHTTQDTPRRAYICKFHGDKCVFVTGVGCLNREMAERHYPPACPCKCIKPKRKKRKKKRKRKIFKTKWSLDPIW